VFEPVKSFYISKKDSLLSYTCTINVDLVEIMMFTHLT
jgi:hypothetical protein